MCWHNTKTNPLPPWSCSVMAMSTQVNRLAKFANSYPIVAFPCMPSAWEEASVRRVYRGTTYDIRIANAGKKAGAAVAHITIDGAPHDPSQPLPVDGASHSVEVALKV